MKLFEPPYILSQEKIGQFRTYNYFERESVFWEYCTRASITIGVKAVVQARVEAPVAQEIVRRILWIKSYAQT